MPTANFAVTTEALIARFTNLSPGVENLWDFGDGNFAFSANAIHEYERSGSYNVALTVIDETGADTAEQTVQVMETADEDSVFAFPASFPISMGRVGRPLRTERLRYPGSWMSRPKITLFGPYAGADIRNTGTGISFTFVVGIGPGDHRLVEWNENDQAWYVTDPEGNYVWHELSPDSNLLDFGIVPEHLSERLQRIDALISGGNAESAIRVEYHDRYVGI